MEHNVRGKLLWNEQHLSIGPLQHPLIQQQLAQSPLYIRGLNIALDLKQDVRSSVGDQVRSPTTNSIVVMCNRHLCKMRRKGFPYLAVSTLDDLSILWPTSVRLVCLRTPLLCLFD